VALLALRASLQHLELGRRRQRGRLERDLEHRIDARAPRSLVQPTLELLNRLGFAMRQHLHRAVRHVAGVAQKRKAFRLDAGALTKIHALDATGDAKSAANSVHEIGVTAGYCCGGGAPAGAPSECGALLSAAVACRLASCAASRARTYSFASR
jgi:hypothetical protein